MRELTLSNAWPTPLRGANQPLDRQLYQDNRTFHVHYHGKVAGQLAHYPETHSILQNDFGQYFLKGDKMSGGLLAYNFREGYRSEYLAHYIFASFGPAIPVAREDDFGLDLICNISKREGKVQLVESSYGIQIKSIGTDFKFTKKEAIKWLFHLDFPLLFAEVDKAKLTIRIFSTWSLNWFLLGIDSSDDSSWPDEISFFPSASEEFGSPDLATGTIPIGKPILDFSLNDLADNGKREYFQNVLEEWIDLDKKNYFARKAGLSTFYGYTQYETNKKISEQELVWYRQYNYSDSFYKKSKDILCDAISVIGLYCKNNGKAFESEFNDLKQYLEKHCNAEASEFTKSIFVD